MKLVITSISPVEIVFGIGHTIPKKKGESQTNDNKRDEADFFWFNSASLHPNIRCNKIILFLLLRIEGDREGIVSSMV